MYRFILLIVAFLNVSCQSLSVWLPPHLQGAGVQAPFTSKSGLFSDDTIAFGPYRSTKVEQSGTTWSGITTKSSKMQYKEKKGVSTSQIDLTDTEAKIARATAL